MPLVRRIRFAPTASRDLEDVWDYLAPLNVYAAEKTIDGLLGRVELLSIQPLMGRSVSNVGPGIRRIVVGIFLVFYRLSEDDHIEIIRIINGRRDLRKFRLTPSGTAS